MRYLIGLLFLGGLVGGIANGGPPPIDRKANEAIFAQVEAEARARKIVRTMLKDPDSAKFGDIFFGRHGTVCGTVNAKNAFGGYTGAQVFTIDTKYIRISDTATWNKNCASK